MTTSELLDKIIEELKNRLKKEDDFTDYEQVQNYAIKVADTISKAVVDRADSSWINQYGTLDYNLCNELITELLKRDYEYVKEACNVAQLALNEGSNIDLKAILPDYDDDRAHSIVWESANKSLAEFKRDFPVMTDNFSQSIVDDAVKKNADFQWKSGLEPKIVRMAEYKCCEWCSKLEGTYLYEDVRDTGNDVFKRHENCRCKVTYVPSKGNAKDVWSKREVNSDVVKYYKNSIREKENVSYVDVKKEYFNNAEPNKGVIDYDYLYKEKNHIEEVKMAKVIHKYLGGDIVLINEKNNTEQKSPDYLWLGKAWELKTIYSIKRVDEAVRKGLKQIQDNPGGLILCLNDKKASVDTVLNAIYDRIRRKAQREDDIDVIIIRDNKITEIVRYESNA